MSSEDPVQLWAECRESLRTQMTRATWETWLQSTWAVGIEEGVLVVATPNSYALEWLQGRLHRTITSTLERRGHEGGIRFVFGARGAEDGNQALHEVADDEAARRPPREETKAYIELVEFDPLQRGWVQVPSYALNFWQPYLAARAKEIRGKWDTGPFNLWATMKAFAREDGEWPTVSTLADICANGDRQLLIGRASPNRPGWFEVLERERVLWYQRRGNDYLFRLLNTLPLLTPLQVDQLPEARRRAHDVFLDQARLDRDEWEQLTLSTLIQDEP